MSSKKSRNKAPGLESKKARKKAIGGQRNEAPSSRSSWWKPTGSDARGILIAAIYDVLKTSGILLASNSGVLLLKTISDQERWLSKARRSESQSQSTLDVLDVHHAREIADAIMVGVDIAIAIKEREHIIISLWDDIADDNALVELLQSFFRISGTHISARKAELDRYFAEKMRGSLEKSLPGVSRPDEFKPSRL